MCARQRQIAQVINTTGLRGAGGRFLPGSPFIADSGESTAVLWQLFSPHEEGALEYLPGKEKKAEELAKIPMSSRLGRQHPLTPPQLLHQTLPTYCQVCFLNFGLFPPLFSNLFRSLLSIVCDFFFNFESLHCLLSFDFNSWCLRQHPPHPSEHKINCYTSKIISFPKSVLKTVPVSLSFSEV